MTGSYNLYLVALSLAIALVASYTALDLAGRVQSAVKWRRLFWLLGGAVAMGTGIWSMHFVAMLAFVLPQSVNYSVWITLLSLLCAVSASWVALSLLSQPVLSLPLLVSGGAFMGIAIASMHYTGMAGIQLQARIEYDWRLVALSVAIAICASFTALWLAFRLQNESLKGRLWQKLGSACVMGVAISGMHYTGMWATHFIPQQQLLTGRTAIFNSFWLAIAIAIATLFILTIALLASLFDRQLSAQLVREQALQESEHRFRVLIREMQVGILLLNRASEILICNRAALELLNIKAGSELGKVFGSPNWLFLHEDNTPFQPTDLPVQQAIIQRLPIHNVVMRVEYPESQNCRWLLVNADPQIAQDGSVERVVCTFSDITHQKQVEDVLRRSAEMDSLLSRISRMLIDENLDTAIYFTLQTVGQFLGSDRTYLIDYDNQNCLNMTHEWCNQGIEPVIHQFQKLLVESHSWIHSQLMGGKTVQISNGLPPIAKEKADWDLTSIRSRLAVPTLYWSKVVGFIGLDAIRSSRVWSQEEIDWLRLVSEFIAISQARQQAEKALRESLTRERAIARIIQQMRQSLDLETIFNTTTQELRQVIKCDRVLVYRFNPDWSGEFVSESVALGWNVLMQAIDQPDSTQVALDRVDCHVKTWGNENSIQDTYLQETQGDIYRQGKSYSCIADIYQAGFNSCYIEFLEQIQARAYLTVPIFCGERLWGLLGIYQNSSPRTWEMAEIKMVVQIGTQLGVAIQQAELLAKTQYQAQELEKAKEAADAANRAKTSFLANMSHELRTPLNTILGFTQLMNVMNRDGSVSFQHQQYLDIISRSGEHLLKLINDVLEMSKIEAGRTTLNESSFDLHRLLNTLEEMLQLKASTKGLRLTFERVLELPQYVKTDESKLRQVLINLLDNAIKFTKQGEVKLRVSFAKDRGSIAKNNGRASIDFEVEDSGPGIEPNEIDKLFKPFEQTETGLNSVEGTGLGLPISQSFVQLMGGKIGVSSQLGIGSIFRFNIQVTLVSTPIEKTSQLGHRKIVGLAPRQLTYRILVADDNPTDRLLLVKLLNTMGFEVREAQNGQEALAMWEHWEPHLIWMDMRMPVMDGYEVTKRIKASLKGQATVVIALTAYAFEEQRQNSILAGCDDFIRKPFERDKLLVKLSQHLGVQYVYEDETEETVKEENVSSLPSNFQTSITIMSATWVEQLYDAALQCNDRLIFELIEQIPQENFSLATNLTHLAEQFYFDQIATLIRQAKNS